MKFHIEQIAIMPRDPIAARELLAAMGAVTWAQDHVTATGEVFGEVVDVSEAELSFNYEMNRQDGKPIEFEVLHYVKGSEHWLEGASPSVSHLGMHASEEDLEKWRKFFGDRGIRVAQELRTRHHTNPVIAGKKWYSYVIFDTRRILGVDIKMIVRREQP